MAQPKNTCNRSQWPVGKRIKTISSILPAVRFYFFIKRRFAYSSFEMVRSYFKIYKPSFLINCAAYTAVDRAEQEKDLAMQVNAEAVGVLAAVCKENDCRFMHISNRLCF
jgi:dTDP-4-dehydrorhamnose reductase